MLDFYPLFQQIALIMRAKAKRDFERIRRIAQFDAQELTIGSFIRSRHTIIQQFRRGIAVCMRNLQRRLPSITITPLWIRFVETLRRFIGAARTDSVLI